MPSRFLVSPGWPPGRSLALFVAAVLTVASFVSANLLTTVLELRAGPNEYNFAAWEARNLPAKWLYELGEVFRGDRSVEEQNVDIARFFELTAEINRLERQEDAGTQEELQDLHRQRDGIENKVEDTIEDRIGEVIRDVELTRSLPFLPEVVWPPVDFEFTESPRSLARSRRDKIELLGTDLLRADLSLDEVEAIEDETLEEENLSAYASATAGIGAYPSIVDYLGSYETTLQVAAHEWMHNYLFFRPLGFNYYDNNDLRTMNETVADLVGHEIAAEVMRRWPLPVAPTPAPTPESAQPRVDGGAELRKLRGEVDALLAEGKVEEAETLMEARRLELAAQGYYIRKLNQAYFAFNNLYAGESGSPAATNPIGPKIDELRKRSASLSAFVATISGMTTVRELDAALSAQP